MGVICEQVQDVAELGEAADDDARRNQLRFRDLIRVGFKIFSKLRSTLTEQMHNVHCTYMKTLLILVKRNCLQKSSDREKVRQQEAFAKRQEQEKKEEEVFGVWGSWW